MTLNAEMVGYLSGAATALCGLGLAIVRARDREKQRQAILASKTPEQLAELGKLMPMMFRGAALLVVILGATLGAVAPLAGPARAALRGALAPDEPTAERPPACNPASCKPPATCTKDGCVGSAAPPQPEAKPLPLTTTAAGRRAPRLDTEWLRDPMAQRDPGPALPGWAR